MFKQPLAIILCVFPIGIVCADNHKHSAKRCELLPLPGHQVSMCIDGEEKTRWHCGREYPRPFFYPFNGPSGVSLTRMGHPGAPNHDHHRSVWIAHNSVAGSDFWSDTTKNQVRQNNWLCLRDGDNESVMAVNIGWYDDKGKELMEQELVVALIPLANEEHAMEFQLTLRPADGREQITLGKTNFGFLAIRVAKSVSAYFGGGTITNSEGETDESNIFGKRAKWVDYSGPITVGVGSNRKTVVEGITCFDHPSNPRYPTRWHVRADGWMGASFGMEEPYTIQRDRPLMLRYMLHAHHGNYSAERATKHHREFASRSRLGVTKSTAKHNQYDIRREAPN